MTETNVDASWTQAYDPTRARAFYAEQALLSEADFAQLFADTVRVRSLGFEEFDWLLFDHILSAYRHIPLVSHFQAAAAGLGLEYRGIEPLYEYLIGKGLMPPWTLNRTTFYALPKPDLRLGELMTALGLMSDGEVQRGLDIARTIREKVGVTAAVGQIFRSVGRVSMIDFFQVLGHQVGVPFVGLDDSAPEIFSAAMMRTS